MAHGMWHFWLRTRAYTGTGQCLLNYNSKGVQAESSISPLKLKQLFVPFVILLCGYLLALFQFIREMMYQHLIKRQREQAGNSQKNGIEKKSTKKC